MKEEISESQVQRAILDYLAARHIMAFRMQTGASFSEYGGKNRMIRYGVAGMADILAFPQWRDTPVWLEVKSATGKQSDIQKSFQEQVEREEHKYAVVRSIDDVIEALA